MYSRKIIDEKLLSIQEQINLRPKHLQYSLTYHSISQIDEMLEVFKSRTVIENKKPTISDLTQAEINFIENERFICANDFLYWATRYAYIKSSLTDEVETIVRFTPTIAQLICIDAWAESEELYHAIMVLYLKARQLGISTLIELAIAHRVQFRTNINALVASSDPDKTKKMAEKMKLCWEYQPFWLRPEYKILSSKEVWAVFETGSGVTCQHGTAMSGIARGETPDVAHLSELPDFRDAAEDVDAALLSAIHETPATFIALESTAKGKTGQGEWWWKKWKYAVKYFSLNKTRLRPIFLPWFIGTDLYPTTTWAHQFLPSDFPSSWKPKETTLAHAQKCKEYVAESPILRKYLGSNYSVPLHQLYWWEFTRQEYEESGNLAKFLEEFCATPDEAFQRSGYGVFTMEQIEFLRNHTKPLASYYGKPAVFGIIGDGILAENEPLMSEIDQTRPYLVVKSDWQYSEKPKTFRLLPLHHHPDLWNNRLFIYDTPTSSEYATGIDGAEGLEGEGDNSVIQVVKKMTPFSPAEQVAEFASMSLSTAELLPYALAIGTYYSYTSKERIVQCKQVVETAFGGHSLQHQLRLAGWVEFHRWHGAYQSIKRKSTNTIGWETNSWTRPMLITQVVKAIKDGAFRINSPYLIEELSNLQKDSTSSKIEAKGSDHDDRAFASFIAFFSLHDWELYLLSTGDDRTYQSFTSFDHLPSPQGQIISLNEALEKTETKRSVPSIDKYAYNSTLPTLD